MKNYCLGYERNLSEDGEKIDNFCRHYKGDKVHLESCSIKCENANKGTISDKKRKQMYCPMEWNLKDKCTKTKCSIETQSKCWEEIENVL